MTMFPRTSLRPTVCGLMLALVASLPTSAWAQSLMDLYKAAREYDAGYQAALAQAKATEFRARQADALLLPTVGLAGSVRRSYVDTPDPTSPTAAAIAAGYASANTQSQIAIEARQPLFDRSKSAQVSQAEKSLLAAQADLQIAEQDLIVRTAQAYFDVLSAQDALAAAQANLKAIGEQLAAAKRNFEVGNVTVTDVREAQARSDAASAQEIAAMNDLQTKRAALDQLVGKPAVEPKPLMSPVSLPALTPSGVNDWVTLTDGSPRVRQAELALGVARDETVRAKAGHLPTVELVGNVARTHNSETTASGGTRGTTDSASLGVEARLSLFNGFAIQNRVRETLALEEKSERDLDSARRSVQLGTRQAFLGVQSGLALVKANEAAESSYKLALEATQLGYRVGVRVNLDVLNAQRDLYNSQRDLAKSRHDVLVAGLRLRQAAGTLTAADLQEIDQLLAK